MYAIVDWHGKQYRLEVGQRVSLDRFQVPEGTQLELGSVLLLASGERVEVGTPVVEGARVTARVLRHYRGRKGYGFKYKAKKRYSRRWGFRADLTEVVIERIEGASQTSEGEPVGAGSAEPKEKEIGVAVEAGMDELESAEIPDTVELTAFGTEEVQEE